MADHVHQNPHVEQATGVEGELQVRKWAFAAAALMVVGVFGAVAVFGAYLAGRYELIPFRALRALEVRLFGSYWDRSLESARLTSIFVDLKAESALIPYDRLGTGGGLTSYGDDIVLVTYEGRIFTIRSSEEIVETSIEVPPYNFDAYEQVAKEDGNSHLEAFLAFFRYNDIATVSVRGRDALALSYTYFDPERICYASRVALLDIPPDVNRLADFEASADDWRVILSTEPCLPLNRNCPLLGGHMAGGRMAFAAPSKLYFASGDYGIDGLCGDDLLAQDADAQYGRVIAIDLDDGTARSISMGNRNMQGIALDDDGNLWTVEHGPRGGDELNLMIEGENYGWPLESLGTGYDKLQFPTTISYGRHETYRAPVFAWLPSVAISNLIQIHGFDDAWDGDLLMASLRSESLFRTRIRNDRVLFSEQIQIGAPIRYVHQHTDGRIVLWTDQHSIVFLTPSRFHPGRDAVEAAIARMDPDPDFEISLRNALAQCNECHALEPHDDVNAPSLARVFGAPVASTDYANYSAALRALDGRWNRERLDVFLSDPGKIAPGTSMAAIRVENAQVRGALIDLLAATSAAFEDLD